MLPSYVNELPRALSLSHPATYEDDDDEHDTDPSPDRQAPTKVEQEPFDPMAAPMEFYRNFKERISSLREEAAAPNMWNMHAEVRNSEAVIDTAGMLEPSPKEEEPTIETLEHDPSLVYTDAAQYLAEFGVNLPMWDSVVDEEIRALDKAHLDTLAQDLDSLALDESSNLARQAPLK